MADASATRTGYWLKAAESLEGAESEYALGRYNNAANRCYYACFQAAIAALLAEGISAADGVWEHRYVLAQFNGQLINRRKRYPAELRRVLPRLMELRQNADYSTDGVQRREVQSALRDARQFLEAISSGGMRR